MQTFEMFCTSSASSASSAPSASSVLNKSYDQSKIQKNSMGEAKRRKEALAEKYGQETKIFPWLPITKSQGEQFVNWSTQGAWIGIGFLIVYWLVIRFLGPAFGWWQVE